MNTDDSTNASEHQGNTTTESHVAEYAYDYELPLRPAVPSAGHAFAQVPAQQQLLGQHQDNGGQPSYVDQAYAQQQQYAAPAAQAQSLYQKQQDVYEAIHRYSGSQPPAHYYGNTPPDHSAQWAQYYAQQPNQQTGTTNTTDHTQQVFGWDQAAVQTAFTEEHPPGPDVQKIDISQQLQQQRLEQERDLPASEKKDKAEAKKQDDSLKRQKALDARRKAKEDALRKAEEWRLHEESKKKLAEESRQAAHKKRQDQEDARKAKEAAEKERRREEAEEVKRKRDLDAAKKAEEKSELEARKRAEAAKKADERQAMEAARREEAGKRAREKVALDAQKREDAVRSADERKALAAAKREETAKRAEEKRVREAAKREEAAKRAEERRAVEAAKREEDIKRAMEKVTMEAQMRELAAKEKAVLEASRREEAARKAEQQRQETVRRAEERRQEAARREIEREEAEASREAKKQQAVQEKKEKEAAEIKIVTEKHGKVVVSIQEYNKSTNSGGKAWEKAKARGPEAVERFEKKVQQVLKQASGCPSLYPWYRAGDAVNNEPNCYLCGEGTHCVSDDEIDMCFLDGTVRLPKAFIANPVYFHPFGIGEKIEEMCTVCVPDVDHWQPMHKRHADSMRIARQEGRVLLVPPGVELRGCQDCTPWVYYLERIDPRTIPNPWGPSGCKRSWFGQT